MVWHENFPSNKHANLHLLATLFNNTNAVAIPRSVTRMCMVCSAKHLRIPAKLQILDY